MQSLPVHIGNIGPIFTSLPVHIGHIDPIFASLPVRIGNIGPIVSFDVKMYVISILNKSVLKNNGLFNKSVLNWLFLCIGTGIDYWSAVLALDPTGL